MENLSRKSALVIGGSGGIGRSVSEMLVDEGLEVFSHGSKENSRFPEGAKSVVYDFFAHDFSELENSELSQIAGKADVLCVCFGPFLRKSIDKMTLDEWKKIALYDFALPGFFVSRALPSMLEKGFGRIVLFGGTGTSHRTEFKTNAAYSAAKSSLGVLVESTAAAYSRFGITCNAVLPGFVPTEYNAAAPIPEGMAVDSKSVAECVKFLIKTPEINGAVLRVDRGWSPLFC